MTALFDADRYGPGREPRVKHEVIPETVVNQGAWHLIVRRGKEPYPLAHKLEYKVTTVIHDGKQRITPWAEGMRWEGGFKTPCGLVGAALDLPVDANVNVCPRCRERAV